MILESEFDLDPLVIEHFDHSSFYESVMHDLEIRKAENSKRVKRKLNKIYGIGMYGGNCNERKDCQ